MSVDDKRINDDRQESVAGRRAAGPMTIGGTVRFSTSALLQTSLGREGNGARRTIFLKTLVQKEKCRQAKNTGRRHGRPKQHKRSKVDIAPT